MTIDTNENENRYDDILKIQASPNNARGRITGVLANAPMIVEKFNGDGKKKLFSIDLNVELINFPDLPSERIRFFISEESIQSGKFNPRSNLGKVLMATNSLSVEDLVSKEVSTSINEKGYRIVVGI